MVAHYLIFLLDSWIALHLICLFYVCGNLLFGCFCKNLWYLIYQNLFGVRPVVFIGLMALQTLPCHMCIPNGWQITFVMLSLGFCLLSKSPPPPFHPLFLMDSIKLDGIATKNKWKIHTCSAFYFKFWRYFLAIPVLLFLILCQLLHISRYDFLEIFGTSFNLTWKNIFLSLILFC